MRRSFPFRLLLRLRHAVCRLHRNQQGATMLEWVLLVAAIALPSYVIIRVGLALLITHYRLVTTLNGMPFP
ncbi:MAG: hypothetical protein V3V20_09740 [Algisphaera sp.]